MAIPVQSNLDFGNLRLIVGLDATETRQGVAEVATQAETDAGTDDTRMVTPLKLKNSSFSSKKFTTLVGNGALLTVPVVHNLNTVFVDVTVNIVASGQVILVEWVVVDANTVNLLYVVTPPGVNAHRVLVEG